MGIFDFLSSKITHMLHVNNKSKNLTAGIILFLIFLISCHNDSNNQAKNMLVKTNDLEKLELKGSVKSLRQFHTILPTANDGTENNSEAQNPPPQAPKNKFYAFNKKGNLTNLITYEPDSSIAYSSKYEYNLNGNRTKECYLDANGQSRETKTMKYDTAAF
jgi:hypothetical protein